MSELIQTGFDYAALPVDSADQLRTWKIEIAAFTDTVESSLVQIGLRFQQARDELNRQGVKGEGFSAWVESETKYSRSSAYGLINVANKFKDKLRPNFGRSVLYALSSPSTSEAIIDKAVAKAESGEKVTVADVKDWKALEAELEAERQAREKAEREVEAERRINGDWERTWTKQSIEHRNQIQSLELDLEAAKTMPESKSVVVEKEVIPDDYEDVKAQAAQLATIKADLDKLKKEQTKIIDQQVKVKLQGYQSEVDKLEEKKKTIEEIVDRKKAYLDSLDSEVKRLEVHQSTINGVRLELIGLASFLNDLDPINDKATIKKWLALAGMLDDASQGIRSVFAPQPQSGHRNLQVVN